MNRLVYLWRNHRLLLLAFVVVFGVAMVLGYNALHHGRNFEVAKDQPIAGWMTPRYVSRSWKLPREKMAEALNVNHTVRGPVPLEKVAEEQGITLEALIARIEAAIAEHRAASP